MWLTCKYIVTITKKIYSYTSFCYSNLYTNQRLYYSKFVLPNLKLLKLQWFNILKKLRSQVKNCYRLSIAILITILETFGTKVQNYAAYETNVKKINIIN